MSRLVGLLLVGLLSIGLTGCVGPMGAGCCGTGAGLSCGGVGCTDGCLTGCDSGSCDSGACGTGACGECSSCTGCGELYVDPWVNHPADCVDPCDACGNYNGQSCGKCRSVFAGFKSLWGYRCGCAPGPVATTDRCFAPSCGGCDGGCDSCVMEPACGCEGDCGCSMGFEPACGCEGACGCGEPACGFEVGCGLEPACGCEAGGCSCGSGHFSGGQVSMGHGDSTHVPLGKGEYVVESPHSTSGTVTEKPYKPHRTRKIFNPRTETARGFLNEYRR